MIKLKELFYLLLLYWKISFESNLDILVCPLNGAQGVAMIAKTARSPRLSQSRYFHVFRNKHITVYYVGLAFS